MTLEILNMSAKRAYLYNVIGHLNLYVSNSLNLGSFSDLNEILGLAQIYTNSILVYEILSSMLTFS